MEYNKYTMVSLATDIYSCINNELTEHDVPLNLNIIPDLCNLMGDHKIAKNGVFLGVEHDISLMIVNEHPNDHLDFDFKFYEETIVKNGIPFVERHIQIIKHKRDIEIPYLNDILDMCRTADFIVDEC